MSAATRQWTRSVGDRSYIVSTDKSLLDHAFIQRMFASKDAYWTKPVSDASLRLLVANSCCFGLYLESASGALQQVGLARLITDYATLAYLTDVLILEEHRGGGLGKWLIACVDQTVAEMEDLRRFLLLTGKGSKTVAFYEGFGLSEKSLEDDGLCAMVRNGPGVLHTDA